MQEGPNSPPDERSERRAYPRFAVDASAVLYLVPSFTDGIPARILDLSQAGCRVRTARPFAAGVRARVELSFKVQGIAFRVSGTTQWIEGRHLLGISFASMSSRRKSELVDLLAELEAKLAAEAAQEAAKDAALEAPAAEAAPRGVAPLLTPIVSAGLFAVPPGMTAEYIAASIGPLDPSPEPAPEEPSSPRPGSQAAPAPIPFPPAGAASPPSPPKKERRAQQRHSVDSRAAIYLVKVLALVRGTIIDVSLGGCRIRTDERLLMGIHQRVEVGFTLDGLPFRLPGVTQAIHNRFTIGIRFLDLSERKREQLRFVIDEIEEMRQEGTLPSGEE